jgi:hypothetical protein
MSSQAFAEQWQVLACRFGYFDESIYPAFCEDDDFVMRLSRLQPPGVTKTLQDVFVLHGTRQNKQYVRYGTPA